MREFGFILNSVIGVVGGIFIKFTNTRSTGNRLLLQIPYLQSILTWIGPKKKKATKMIVLYSIQTSNDIQ